MLNKPKDEGTNVTDEKTLKSFDRSTPTSKKKNY